MNKKQKKMLYRIIISSILWLFFSFLKVEGILKFILFMIPYYIIGYDILKKAFKGILKKQVFDENFLMAIATIGAILLKDYREGVAVMLFYQIGELFQSYAVGKSRKNISELMDIRPDYANVKIDGEWEKVDPDEVEIGTLIEVKPGEKIPIDGKVVSGTASLNTSALTGESKPAQVKEGDEVLSGCINLDGLLYIQTTKEFTESTVSKILDLVENASSRKSKSEDFISKFARYYTPAVCYSALFLAFVPPVVSLILKVDPQWSQWIFRALTFLVISCPCALVISIPLSFFAGIVFDKTGTLTKGVFEVSEIKVNQGTREQLIEYAALAESYSSHPISLSLMKAYGKEMDKNRISQIEEISGHGIKAIVDGNRILAGNQLLMEKYKIPYKKEEVDSTIVYVSCNQQYLGAILISDVIKPTSSQAIQQLKKNGIKKTVMLTGDQKKVAIDVARELNIDCTYSQLLPDQKVEKVEALLKEQSKDGKLAFVGDGINDAPVLSRADIGIAMGALGSDAAIEAADVVLMDDDPLKIVQAMRISRKCIRIVYENIVFAIGIKGICLILGALGFANMWMAIFADVGVMVIAVLNAIRVLYTGGYHGKK